MLIDPIVADASFVDAACAGWSGLALVSGGSSLAAEGSFLGALLAAAPAEPGTSWLEMIRRGGLVGSIIIALSVFAVILIIMHLVQIRRNALIPPEQVDSVDDRLRQGQVSGALEYCLDPVNDSYLTRILAAGLTRYERSAFGVFEIKNAIEEAGEEQTARLYRSTDTLGVIGSIAPLLGLLGTVVGMVGAFESISRSAGSQHEQLAENISLALVTTLMGLVLAIPCVALYTFFRNRIDALAAEAGSEIEALLLHLEQSPAAARAAPTGGRTVQAPAAEAREVRS